MGISKQNIEFLLEPLKFKRRKVALESDWDSKKSQNLQTLGFLKKILHGFSKKKSWFFSDTPNVSNLQQN